jgi:hypothetical protein
LGREVSVRLGRKPDPIVGHGPVAHFAAALQAEWVSAGSPKLKSMARDGARSVGSLCEAKRGLKLPSADTTKAFLRACNIEDESQLAAWEVRRRAAQADAARFAPPKCGFESVSDLHSQLHDLISSQGLDVGDLCRRIEAGPKGAEAPAQRLSSAQLTEQIYGPGPLSPTALAALIFAVGGTPEDARQWQRHLADTTVRPAEPEGPRSEVAPSLVPVATVISPIPKKSLRLSVRGYVIAAVATLAVLAIALVVPVGRRSERQVPVTIVEEPPPSPHPESGTARTTASIKLADFVKRVALRSEQPKTGRYTYVHRKVWRPIPVAAGPGPAERETTEDIRLWWAPDYSGRRVIESTDASSLAERTEAWFVVGELLVPLSKPSTNQRQLGIQLDALQGPELGAVGRLRAVATVNDFYDLDPAQRACVLHVLADAPGITYRGSWLDKTGRAGLAFSADLDEGPGVTRETLIFHEKTGILLARQTAARPGSGDGQWRMTAESTYLDRARVPTID